MVRIFLLLSIAITFSFVKSYELEISFELTSPEWKKALVDMFLGYSFNKLSASDFEIVIDMISTLRRSIHKDLYTKFITIYSEEDLEVFKERNAKLDDLKRDISTTFQEISDLPTKINNKKNELEHNKTFYNGFKAVITEIEGLNNDNPDFTKNGFNSDTYILKLERILSITSKSTNNMKTIEKLLKSFGADKEQNNKNLKQLNNEYEEIGRLISQIEDELKRSDTVEAEKSSRLSTLETEKMINESKVNEFINNTMKAIKDVINPNINNITKDTENKFWPENLPMNIIMKSATQPLDPKDNREFQISATVKYLIYHNFVKPIDIYYSQDQSTSFFKLISNEKVFDLNEKTQSSINPNDVHEVKQYSSTIAMGRGIEPIDKVDAFAEHGAKFKKITKIDEKMGGFPQLTETTKLECSLVVQNIEIVKAVCQILGANII